MTPALRRRLFFAALYFSEGAPIGWLWWTLPSQLRQSGVEVAAITALTAALAIPWACKFLWAPLIDLLQARWFGLRAWLVIAQLGMAATLVPMLSIDPAANWSALFGWLLAHAFFAATQDVAIDALAIRSVPANERGSLNGAMQVGMIAGRLLFSSGVLYLATTTGAQVAVPMLLAVTAGACVLVLMMPRATLAKPRSPVGGRRMRYLRVLLATPRFWRLVFFALVAGAGFEAAGSLSGSWTVDRGISSGGIATFRLITAVLMAIGAWLAGRMADHRGARLVARTWLVALAILIAATAISDMAQARTVALICYAATYFAIGAFTASSYALFMQSANGPLAATVFSTFMGLTNACEAWAGKLGGWLQQASGYGVSLLVLMALSLLALPLLPHPTADRRRKTLAAGKRAASGS